MGLKRVIIFIMPKHKALNQWVKECAELCKPDRIVWCDGSEEERARLEKEAIKTGELMLLNQKKLPGCVYHRTALNDVARTEHLTYICTKSKKDAGPNNNWMLPQEGYKRAGDIFKNRSMGFRSRIICTRS